MRSRACAPLSPYPRRYFSTSSRARTAWEISSSIDAPGSVLLVVVSRKSAVVSLSRQSPVSVDSLVVSRQSLLHRPTNGFGKVHGRCRAAQISCADLAVDEDGAERAHDAVGGGALVDVLQHQHRGEQQ